VGTDKRERQKANRERARQERIRKQQVSKVRRRGLIFGVGIPVIIIALFAISRATGGDDTAAPADSTNSSAAPTNTEPTKAPAVEGGKTVCPKTDGTQVRAATFTAAITDCIDESKSYTAIFDTSEGTVEVALDTKNVPGTVNNFVSLSRYKYYDGTTIFRTDPSIDIIQGGGFSASDSVGYTIKDEGTGFKYSEGDLVMARTGAADSAGAQYFFATGPNVSKLDGQGTYVTFGKVSKGLDVLKKIIGLHEATSDGLGGQPSRTVTVNSISITEK
jgi:peptidylprolyl isomerase